MTVNADTNVTIAAIILAAIFAICGSMAITVAIFNSDWFFKSPNAGIFTFGLPRLWQRLIYGVAGLLMLISAFYILTYGH